LEPEDGNAGPKLDGDATGSTADTRTDDSDAQLPPRAPEQQKPAGVVTDEDKAAKLKTGQKVIDEEEAAPKSTDPGATGSQADEGPEPIILPPPPATEEPTVSEAADEKPADEQKETTPASSSSPPEQAAKSSQPEDEQAPADTRSDKKPGLGTEAQLAQKLKQTVAEAHATLARLNPSNISHGEAGSGQTGSTAKEERRRRLTERLLRAELRNGI